MKLLEGKTALVTGAGRGIGRGIAIALAKAGANIVVNDFGVALDGQNEADTPAGNVVAEIEAMGGHAVINRGSVAEFTDAADMVKQAIEINPLRCLPAGKGVVALDALIIIGDGALDTKGLGHHATA